MATTRLTFRILPSYRAGRIPAAILAMALTAPALAQQGFDQAHPNQVQNQPPPQGQYQGQGQYPGQPMPPANPGALPGQAGQPGFPPDQGQAGFGSGQGQAGMAPDGQGHPLQALAQMELQDHGVPAQRQLQANLHGPTPTSIPGGQVITTDRLLGLYQQGQQNGLLVFHVLGPGQTLPHAQNAVGASQPGSFDDPTQQEFGQYLQQVTQGNKRRPMVFYCLNTQCWMSYNAALRAIQMGFTQVYWYRGGIEAWQYAEQLAANMNQGWQMPPPSGYRTTGHPQQGGW